MTTLKLIALGLLLAACGQATWSDALREAEAQPRLSIARAELRFVVARDAAGALADAEALLAQAEPGSELADRALLLALEASRATGELERPLPFLAKVLSATRDPVLAERFASELDRYWGRLDGGDPLDGLAGTEVSERTGDAWEPARAEAAMQRYAIARRSESERELWDFTQRAGIPTRWRLSAPWGRTPELDLARALGPETRALGERETTGAGWNLEPIATTRGTFSDGEVTFFDMAQIGGVGFAEVDQPLSELASGTVRIRLETNRLAKVYVGGREVVARTRSDAPWSTSVTVVRQPDERVTVKLASADGTGFFRLRMTGLAEPTPAGSLARAIQTGDAHAVLRTFAWLDAQISRPLLDVAGARATIERLRAVVGAHPALDLLAARFARVDARVPVATQRVEARAHLDAVLRTWPKNPVATRALARLEKEEQHADRALALLQDDGVRTLLERLEIQRDRGWEADALDTIRALRERPGLMVNSARVQQEAIDTERTFGRIDAAERDLVLLAQRSPNLAHTRAAELAIDAGELMVAGQAYLHAFTLAPERHALLRSAVAAWRADGTAESLSSARAMLAAFLDDRPDDGWALAERARIVLQSGDRDGALRELSALLERHPDFVPVALLIAVLRGQALDLDAIDDGTSVMRDYRAHASAAAYAPFPIVSVLERTHIAVEDDGSTLEVQHRIRLVQSRAGADALGDFRPPDGARLLVARTLKADGRVLYPERTEGKADSSFPELQVGDAVETAWVARSRVSPSEGGYLTGISFAGYSTPTWKQDVQVSLAPGMALAPTRFGGAPEAVVSDLGGGRRAWAWRRDGLPPVPREPQSVGARSFFPFADLRVVKGGEESPLGAWQQIAEAFASRLVRVLAPGPRTLAQAHELRTPQAAFSWVKSDLEDAEQLNLFETPVETAIVAGKGHRALALVALLRAQGHAAELWLCAPERDGPPEDRAAPTPNANRFFYPLVVIGPGTPAVVLLDPSRPWMPWNTVPAELQGARCLVPERVGTEPALFVDVPALHADAPPSFETHLDITLAANGEAKVVVQGLARGVPAVPLRQLWATVDDEKKRALWEQWAATMALDARVDSYRVDDAADPDKPIRWELALTFPSWARVQGDVLEVPKPLAPMAAADFASVPELSQLVALPVRATPLRVPAHSERMGVRLHVPAGFTVATSDLPPALDESFGPNRLHQTVEPRRDGFELVRVVRFVPGRVDPVDYARFKAFIDGGDRGMSAPIRAVRTGR